MRKPIPGRSGWAAGGWMTLRWGALLLLVGACGDSTGPNRISISVEPAVRSATAIVGQAAPSDSVMVSMAGPNADSTFWVAARRSSWLVLATPNGKGSARLRWFRESTDLEVGTYVDTITVTVVGSPTTMARVVDTLRVLPPPPPTGPFTISSTTVSPGGTLSVTSGDFRVWNGTVRLQFEDLMVPMSRSGVTEFTATVPPGMAPGPYSVRLLLGEYSFVLPTVTVTAGGGAP